LKKEDLDKEISKIKKFKEKEEDNEPVVRQKKPKDREKEYQKAKKSNREQPDEIKIPTFQELEEIRPKK
jgi:hypothetical protein